MFDFFTEMVEILYIVNEDCNLTHKHAICGMFISSKQMRPLKLA